MDSEKLIAQMQQTRLMRSKLEVESYQHNFTLLQELPASKDLYMQVIRLLDDDCLHPEVMFGTLQYLEEEYNLEMFVITIPQLPQIVTAQAEGWLGAMFNRACNEQGGIEQIATLVILLEDNEQKAFCNWIMSNNRIKEEHKSRLVMCN